MNARYAKAMENLALFHDRFTKAESQRLNFEFQVGDHVPSDKSESLLQLLFERPPPASAAL